MTEFEALQALKDEGLGPYAWMDEPHNLVNGAGVFPRGGEWVVVPTGERAAREDELVFDSEAEALDRFIAILRSVKPLRDQGIIA